jgi:hypothetical protein
LVSAGGNDIFLATYTSGGTPVWAKRFGGVSEDQGNAVTLDGSGNVVMTGSFQGSADFAGGNLSASASGRDVFVAKYTAAGTHLWSHGYGDAFVDDIGNGVAVDAAGNVTVTGWFGNWINFGGGDLFSHGGPDGFLASFTP